MDPTISFIIKELAKECEEKFACLGENFSVLTFSVLIEKKLWKLIKKKNCKNYILHIDSAIFMASLLSNLVDNLAGGID